MNLPAFLGFIPLSYYKESRLRLLLLGNFAQKPALYDTADATANSRINARLPYIFAGSWHCALPENYSAREYRLHQRPPRAELELNTWILARWLLQNHRSGDELQASHPLRDNGKVIVEDIEDKPGLPRQTLCRAAFP